MDEGSPSDESEDQRYTRSNNMDDLDGVFSRSGFSIDDGQSQVDLDLKTSLDELDISDHLSLHAAGREMSVRLALPPDGDDIRFDQVDTFRSKSSLGTSPTSFTPQYLSTGTADDDNENNNNFSFDQFLKTLQNSDGPESDDENSSGYDHRMEGSVDDGSVGGASKSEVFSESLLKSEERTLKSGSGVTDIFENTDERTDSKEYDGPRTSANYISFPYGFQQKNGYEHNKKLTDLVDVTFNPRTRQFIFLDTRGITTWDKDGIEHAISRSLNFPKYQNKLLRNIIYARKYNVYFCLAKDFSLKVLNKDFDETCQVASDLSSVMFLLFNPVRDELITGGVKGTKVWEYRQMADRVWTEIKPMANYSLFLKRELKAVGGSWVRKVELDQTLQQLYCCSDTDIQCYDMEGRLLFKLNKAHRSQINGCKYSHSAKLLVTCANDCDVKIWSMTGGMVHTFRGHSRAVTNLLLHPDDSSLVLSSSLDGSVKMWSLDVMELMFSIVVSTEGIQWMGLTGEKYLWTATCRDASVWQLNQTVRFFALARCKTTSLQVAHADGKTSRVVAVGEDSSVRLVSVKEQRNLSTVLPPPSISPLQQVQSVTYNRDCSLVFVLIDPSEVWVYTMRTDPACRTAVWDVQRIQERWYRGQSASSTRTRSPSPTSRPPSSLRGATSQIGLPNQRATLQGKNTAPSLCSALATINTHVMYWTDEGFVSPLNDNFVLFGLQDGRILFLDPVKQGHRYCELQATRDAILDITFDRAHSNLIVKSSLREEDLFQFWSIPSLELKHEVLVTQDVTSYARLGLSFFTGHTDGSLIMFTLEQVDTSKNRFQHGGYTVDTSTSTCIRRKEHQAPIVAVDSCPILGIVATCSSDGAVKIWDEQRTLMTEIALDNSLSSACFLTIQGDLMIGYKNHLFVIDHSRILPSITKQQAVDDILESESEIYEDPSVRYEGAAANPEALNVDNYLVPFDLDFNEKFLGGQKSPEESEHSSEKGSEEDSESEFSMAKTEVYASQVSTPRLSVVDLLTAVGEPSKKEITEKTLSLALKKRKKSRTVRWTQDQHGIQPRFEMPRFGISPGPSPTCTPPSTPSDVSESEDSNDDKEYLDEEEEQELEVDLEEKEFEPINIPSETAAPQVAEKAKKVEPKVQDYRLPEHLQEKGRFSRMKIDAMAIMFATKSRGLDMKKQINVKPVKVVSSDDHKQQKAASDQPDSAKVKQNKSIPIKKKGLKGSRARVGERAASAAAAQAKADREAAAAAVAAASQEKETKPKKKTSKTKAKEPLLKPVETQKPAPKEDSSNKEKAKLSTTKLDIKPLPKLPDVRTGVKPGPTIKANKEAPKNGKRQSVLSGFTKSKKKTVKEEEEEEDAGKADEEDKTQDHATTAPATTDDATKHDVTMVADLPKTDDVNEADGKTSPQMDGIKESDETADGPGADGQEEDGAETKDPTGPGSTQSSAHDISRGASSSLYKSISRAAIIEKYGSHRAQSASVHDDALVDDDLDDEDVRIPSAMSYYTEGDVLQDSQRLSSRGMRAQSALSTVSGNSYRTLYVAGDVDHDFYPLEEIDLDLYEQPNFEVMLSRNGRIEHIGSATSRTESPFMRSVSQATGRVMSSRAGDKSVLGSVLSDVEAELLQGRMSVLESEMMTSEVGLPVSPEWFGSLARPNTAEGRERRSRPQTAGAEMHVTFQEEDFDDLEGIPKFMSFPVTPANLTRCYKNDGLQFEGNWQERMLERNRLMKLQKQQRTQSAAKRRHLLELRQRQRRKSMIGHTQCTDDLLYPQDRMSSPAPTALSQSAHQSKQLHRAQSAPAGRLQYDRVKSAPAGRLQYDHPHSRCSARQTHSAMYKEQSDFGAERPYRLRLNQQQTKPKMNNSEIFQAFENDPSASRPKLVRRSQISKSIPSKTRRFVLLTQHQSQPAQPIPSPLERQLLKARFPKKHVLMEPEDWEAIPRRHSTPNASRVASVADFVM